MDQRVETPTWLEGDTGASVPQADNPAKDSPASDSTAQVGPPLSDTPADYAAGTPGRPDADPHSPEMAPPMTSAHPPMPADPGASPNGAYGAVPPGPAAEMRMADPFAAPQPEPRGPVGSITAPFAALKLRSRKPPKSEQGTGFGAPQYQQSSAPAPTRRAQLVLSRIEPWSVMKLSFMISLVGWVVLFVVVAILYYALSKLGVFHSIESTVGQVTSSKGSAGTNAAKWFAASRILGYTMLVGAINVVLITAISTIGAVVYNLLTHVSGGVEVTLKETD
ncbi:MAG: DUF3566 domain-containing protein [Streptosporangiaceae bacterium]